MLCTKSHIYVAEVIKSHIRVFLKIQIKKNVFSTKLNQYDIYSKSRCLVLKPLKSLDSVNLLSRYCSPQCSGIVTHATKAQSSNICDMLCTKSHVYVDKVTTCCALNHIYISPGLLKNMYVLSSVVGSYLLCDIMPVSISHRLVQVIPGVQFAQHWHIWNHFRQPPDYAYYSVLKS